MKRTINLPTTDHPGISTKNIGKWTINRQLTSWLLRETPNEPWIGKSQIRLGCWINLDIITLSHCMIWTIQLLQLYITMINAFTDNLSQPTNHKTCLYHIDHSQDAPIAIWPIRDKPRWLLSDQLETRRGDCYLTNQRIDRGDCYLTNQSKDAETAIWPIRVKTQRLLSDQLE